MRNESVNHTERQDRQDFRIQLLLNNISTLLDYCKLCCELRLNGEKHEGGLFLAPVFRRNQYNREDYKGSGFPRPLLSSS